MNWGEEVCRTVEENTLHVKIAPPPPVNTRGLNHETAGSSPVTLDTSLCSDWAERKSAMHRERQVLPQPQPGPRCHLGHRGLLQVLPLHRERSLQL